jgi:multiple antibiotic resistance protein
MTFSDAFTLFIKFFFLLTPPFVISVFLAVTKDNSEEEKRSLANHITAAILVVSAVLLFFGGFIFQVFGITLNAFKIGTGAILFLTAVSLVQGGSDAVRLSTSLQSIAVVPMAIPVTLGPGSIGCLLVYGGELNGIKDFGLAFFAIAAAVLCVGILLWMSYTIERIIGKNGLVVLSKLTGLILAALSAQMIFEGAQSFLSKCS